MPQFANIFTTSLEVLTVAAARAGADAFESRALGDTELLSAQRTLAEVKRHVDTCAAVLAGETVRRSSADAGLDGLARKQGFRTAEALVRGVTGSTAREATALIRVGSMLNDVDLMERARAEGKEDPAEALWIASKPWLVAAGTAVTRGILTVAGAEALRNGLGEPGPGVSSEALAEVATTLVAAIANFSSTIEQLASDSFLELMQLAVDTDPTTIVGVHRPAVRVLVAAKDLHNRNGRGWIEGHDVPVSIATVDRHICGGAVDEIVFDNKGQPENLGRAARYFNRSQRRLLSARDGGCRWPGCERPPEWTEAHHISWWDRDNGPTDINNGILLCRHHHLLLHDNHWEREVTTRGGPSRVGVGVGAGAGAGVGGRGESDRSGTSTATGERGESDRGTAAGERDGAEYWLVPPRDVDPAQTRRFMPSKSPALHDALRMRELLPA